MHLTDSLLQDVRFGFRVIQRNPLLSCAVVLTLALGIGVDTAVFTAVNGMQSSWRWWASYGAVAFALNRRTREMGIRRALGATCGDIVRSVLVSGMRPVFGGLLAGLVLSAGASLVLSRVLFGVRSWDPMVYSAVSLLLATGALAAMFGPALRAAQSDPMQALRRESV